MSYEIDFTQLDALVGDSDKIQWARKIDKLLTDSENYVPFSKMIDVDTSQDYLTSQQEKYDKARQIINSIRKYLKNEYGVELEEQKITSSPYKGFRYPLHNYGTSTPNRNPLARHKQVTKKLYLPDAKRALTHTSGFLPQPLRNSLFEGTEIFENKHPFVELEDSLLLTGIKWFPEIFDAILTKKILIIRYRKIFKYDTVVLLHPQYLKHYNRRWYVCGRTVSLDSSSPQTIEDNVILALDRIIYLEEASDSSDYVPAPEGYYSTLFDDIIGVTRRKNSPVRTVKLKVYNEYVFNLISSKKLHHSQKEQVVDDERFITLRVRLNKELVTNILSFGSDIEVVTPRSLRISIAEEAKKMYDRYSQTSHQTVPSGGNEL